MRDTCDIMQMAVYNALAGNVTYNGSVIPGYDEKVPVNEAPDLYWILSTQTESDEEQTDDAFITTSSIDIEIIDKSEFEVSKKRINGVSNSILEILFPTPATDGLPVQNLFQILNLRRTRTITRNLSLTASESVLQKIITIQGHIVQQNH